MLSEDYLKMAETHIGIRCKDFVLLAAAGVAGHYYIKFADSEDKIVPISSHQMISVAGENGPRNNFAEYVKANLALNQIRSHGRPSSTPSTAAFMRHELAKALRSRDGAYEVNTLLAGFDQPVSEFDETPAATHLYYMDYLGTLQEVPYACHGYGTPFVVALLDRYWKPDLTPQEGITLLQQCCNEVKKRIIVAHDQFICKVVTKDGIEVLPQIK